MPLTYKSHSSHDIVLLCSECSIACNHFDDLYAKSLEIKYPVKPVVKKSVVLDNDLLSIMRAAKAMYLYYTKGTPIPQERRDKLDAIVHEYLYKNNKSTIFSLWIIH